MRKLRLDELIDAVQAANTKADDLEAYNDACSKLAWFVIRNRNRLPRRLLK